jgi:hypothetical protein
MRERKGVEERREEKERERRKGTTIGDRKREERK